MQAVSSPVNSWKPDKRCSKLFLKLIYPYPPFCFLLCLPESYVLDTGAAHVGVSCCGITELTASESAPQI